MDWKFRYEVFAVTFKRIAFDIQKILLKFFDK